MFDRQFNRAISVPDQLTRWMAQATIEGMRATIKLEVTHWPYGLEVQPTEGELLLRPSRKARAGWAKGFRARKGVDELSGGRGVPNSFDEAGWEWQAGVR